MDSDKLMERKTIVTPAAQTRPVPSFPGSLFRGREWVGYARL